MSPALANFLFETANFLLLAAALGWLLFKPVRAALDRDRAQHEKETAEAQRLRAEAEALSKEALAVRGAADREIEKQRAEILAAAQKEAARVLEEAKKAQAAERSTLQSELQATRQAEAAMLAETVGQVAAESVRRLLLALQGPALDLALVKVMCEQLRALPEAARRGALVESARALDSDAKGLLQAVLVDGFKERTVVALGAGLRVTTSVGQVDASALSFAREAARATASALAADRSAGDGHG